MIVLLLGIKSFKFGHLFRLKSYINYIDNMGKELLNSDKELLLIDLCARLPYGVKVESVFINLDTKEHKSCGIEVFDATSILMIRDGLGEFKPYLFPLSSMTEEQKLYLEWFTKYRLKDGNLVVARDEDDEYLHANIYDYLSLIEWLNKNHFDYRGLIEKGVAIDATGLNVYN